MSMDFLCVQFTETTNNQLFIAIVVGRMGVLRGLSVLSIVDLV